MVAAAGAVLVSRGGDPWPADLGRESPGRAGAEAVKRLRTGLTLRRGVDSAHEHGDAGPAPTAWQTRDPWRRQPPASPTSGCCRLSSTPSRRSWSVLTALNPW